MWVTGSDGKPVLYRSKEAAEQQSSMWLNAMAVSYGYDRDSCTLYGVWIIMPEGWDL